jgi:hypothetical protein
MRKFVKAKMKTKKLLSIGLVIGLFFLLHSGGGSSVRAAGNYSCGYQDTGCGYFYGHNIGVDGDVVLSCGLDDNTDPTADIGSSISAQTLEDDIVSWSKINVNGRDYPSYREVNARGEVYYNYCKSQPATYLENQYKTAADFIILTMLNSASPGYPDPFAPSARVNNSTITDWLQLVDIYNSQQYNGSSTYNPHYAINATQGVCLPNSFYEQPGDADYNQQGQPTGGTIPSSGDVSRYCDYSGTLNGSYAVAFISSDGKINYEIRIGCGNPLGQFNSGVIPQGDSPPSLTAACNADGTITGTASDPDGTPVTVKIQQDQRTTDRSIVGIAGYAGDTGYWEVESDGTVFQFGQATPANNAGPPNGAAIVGIVGTSDGLGFWMVDSYGNVYARGDALKISTGANPVVGNDVTGMASTPDGQGYWLVTKYGDVYAFGDAGDFGTSSGVSGYGGPGEPNIVGVADDKNIAESSPVVGGVQKPLGYYGYWLIGSNGTILGGPGPNPTVSQAPYLGEWGPLPLTGPGSIRDVGIVADPTAEANPANEYYYEFSSEGHIWNIPPSSPGYGSPQGTGPPVVGTITGMATTSNGQGYWEVDNNGQVYNYGNAKDYGWAIPQYLGETTAPGPDTTGTNFEFVASQYLTTTKTFFNITAEDVLPAGYSGPSHDVTYTRQCGSGSSSDTATCNFNNTSGTAYVAEPFVINMSIPYVGSSPLTGTASITVASSTYGPLVTGTSSPLSATQTVTINAFGSHQITGTFTPSGGGRVVHCSAHTVIVYLQPYLSVSGGDVSVGGKFGTTCSDSTALPPPGVSSWNDDANGYHGAGSQFAVYALGPIFGFASDQINPVPLVPLGLSFSNTVDNNPLNSNGKNNGSFGGAFGTAACPTDYFSLLHQSPTAISTPSVNLSALIQSGQSSTYYYKPTSGNLILNPDQTVPDSTQVNVYVVGNVYIPSDIKYSGSGWSSVGAIPAFRLFVSGNIYIDSSVGQLDGVYVAQPNPIKSPSPTNGVIYDCSAQNSGLFVQVPVANISSCYNQLTINGSFTAYKIHFERVSSTLGTGTTGQPAEQFNYSPAVWLASPPSISTEKYNAIENLPPVL